MNTKKNRKPRASAIANRTAILNAALLVFADKGYEGATTREIAAKAKLELGHLSKYFQSKELLWLEVMRDSASKIQQLLDASALHGSRAQKSRQAREFLPGFLRFFADNYLLTRVMLQEFSVASPRHDWVVKNVGKPIWNRLEPLFEQMKSAKASADYEPIFGYFSLIGAALLFFGSSSEIRTIAGLDPRNQAVGAAYINYLVGLTMAAKGGR
jgi:TetR/AcrR family transcriptional regulator